MLKVEDKIKSQFQILQHLFLKNDLFTLQHTYKYNFHTPPASLGTFIFYFTELESKIYWDQK